MTTCLPSGIPLIEGSDRPCDIDTYTCDLADTVETQLDTVDAVVTRTATTIPIVKLLNTVSITYGVTTSAQLTFFDTVQVDTANMFDATVDATTVNITQSGLYLITSNIFANSTGGGNQTAFGLTVSIPSLINFSHDLSNQTGLGMYTSLTCMAPLNSGATLQLLTDLFIQSTDTITVYATSLSVVWLTDLA